MESVSRGKKHPLIIIVENDPGNAHLLETILHEEARCQTDTSHQSFGQTCDGIARFAASYVNTL